MNRLPLGRCELSSTTRLDASAFGGGCRVALAVLGRPTFTTLEVTCSSESISSHIDSQAAESTAFVALNYVYRGQSLQIVT